MTFTYSIHILLSHNHDDYTEFSIFFFFGVSNCFGALIVVFIIQISIYYIYIYTYKHIHILHLYWPLAIDAI